MKYTAVTFTSSDIEEWQKDLLIAELGDIGFDTFETTETGFVAYISTANLSIPDIDILLVNNVEGYEIDYDVQDMEDQNWNTLWESNFSPIVVDEKCYVRATFHEPIDTYPFQIVIDPKMSFGTGHHHTTSMMLSYILEDDFDGKSVLDMGCGTGILAILASKRGAKDVLAVDYDEICVDSVEENKALNRVTNISSALGSKEQLVGKIFTSILANINRNILLDQLDQYHDSLFEEGTLYLSGFYDGEDLDMIIEKATGLGFVFERKKTSQEWCAAKFVKK